MTDRRKHHRGQSDRRKQARPHSALTHLENLTHDVMRRHMPRHAAGSHKSPSHGPGHKRS